MFKVGITGGIGTGKSTVCHLFELLGIEIYYADQKAKALMHTETVRSKIIQLLGEQAYQNDVLDRVYVASKVFSDKALLVALNKIVHPLVQYDFELFAEKTKGLYVLNEAALLVENGSYKNMDYLIVVSADEALRVKRVMNRDMVSEGQVQERIAAQLPEEDKLAKADFIVYNNDLESLIDQVLQIHQLILNRIDS